MKTNDPTVDRLGDAPIREPVKSIAQQLLARIQSNEYRSGSRLPAERHLADEFDTTRTAIRDALEFLEQENVIRRRPGSGSFVLSSRKDENSRTISPHNVAAAENTGPLELQVVRAIFEPETVRLAVIHMSPKDIEKLRQIIDRMEAVHTDREAYARCEEDFYLQLARGTENPLLIAIFELVTDVRRLAHWRAHRQKTLSPNRIRENQRRHRSMFDAIENRDMESAVEYVRLQLVEEQRGLMREP